MDLRTYLFKTQTTATSLADKLGVALPQVSHWANKKSVPHARYIFAIEKETCGAVSLKDWITE
jgi:DNA-binding transcriptional regulator YdaS (Cro superfamily)